MKFKLILLLLITVLAYSFAPNNTIDIDNFDSNKLEKIIISKVNKLRKSKRVGELKKNKILKQAAQDHCKYLIKKKKLSHYQKSKKKKTPMKRVDFYNGNFSIVGENIASTYIFKSVMDPDLKEGIIINTYSQLGEHFFQLWKNSKDHYENLMDDSYNYTGISFSINKKTKRVCSSQVFGFR